MNQFLFLYPIKEYFETEFQKHGWAYHDGIELFRRDYSSALNKCIDLRYRKKDFQINFATFDDRFLSQAIDLQPRDKIIRVGMDFKTHTTKQNNGTYLYPDSKKLIESLGLTKHLRVAGFHMWDCVEKVAKSAHESGIDVLVDEELTDIFFGRLVYKTDQFENYAGIQPAKQSLMKEFLEARREKPWLWQKY